MFGWLKRLLGRGRKTYDIYHPKERMIYSYFNGQKVIQADPLQLERKLMDVGPELSIDMKVAKSISKDAATAHTKMVQQCRGIFNVKPIEEGGLTELETVLLLEHYLAYTDEVKKNWSPIATPVTGTSAPSGPSSEGNPPTPNSSVSGSTDEGNVTGNPPSSPTAPASPSET